MTDIKQMCVPVPAFMILSPPPISSNLKTFIML